MAVNARLTIDEFGIRPLYSCRLNDLRMPCPSAPDFLAAYRCPLKACLAGSVEEYPVWGTTRLNLITKVIMESAHLACGCAIDKSLHSNYKSTGEVFVTSALNSV